MMVIVAIQVSIFSVVERNPSILLFGLAILPLVLLSSILVIKFIDIINPIVLEKDGITCYTGFGIRARVRWKDVESTRNLILWPGLKWIFLNDGRKILKRPCIPIFVKDRDLFLSEVEKAVGKDHIVTRRLRENGFGSK